MLQIDTMASPRPSTWATGTAISAFSSRFLRPSEEGPDPHGSRSRRRLEAGTAFGTSSLFILGALKALGEGRHLATLEAMKPQFSLASETLRTRYEDMVSCFLGLTEEKLPDLAQSQKTLDFFFHDAGHSSKAYVSDVAAVVDILAPGGVVLIDDIRWEDARFSQEPDTYREWREIVRHARVKWAVEIDGNLGLLLLN